MFVRGFMTMLQGMYHIYLGVCLGFYDLDGPGRSRALGELLRWFPFFFRILRVVFGQRYREAFWFAQFRSRSTIGELQRGGRILPPVTIDLLCTGMAVSTSNVQNLSQPSQPHSDSKSDLVSLLPACSRSDIFPQSPLREFAL